MKIFMSRFILSRFRLRGLSTQLLKQGKKGFIPGGLPLITFLNGNRAISSHVVEQMKLMNMSQNDINTLYYGGVKSFNSGIAPRISQLSANDLSFSSHKEYTQHINKSFIQNYNHHNAIVPFRNSYFSRPASSEMMFKQLPRHVVSTYKIKPDRNIVEYYYNQPDIDRFVSYSFQFAFQSEDAWVKTLSQLHVSILKQYERGVGGNPTGLSRSKWEGHAQSTIQKRARRFDTEPRFKPADIRSMGFSPLRPKPVSKHIRRSNKTRGDDTSPQGSAGLITYSYKLPLLHETSTLHNVLINNCIQAVSLNVNTDYSFFHLAMNYFNAPYALFHEFGTYQMPQRDFIRAGYRYVADELKRKLNRIEKQMVSPKSEGGVIDSPLGKSFSNGIAEIPSGIGVGEVEISGETANVSDSLQPISNSDFKLFSRGRTSTPSGKYRPMSTMGTRFSGVWKYMKEESRAKSTSILPIHKFSFAKTQWIFALLPPINVYKYYGIGVALTNALNTSLLNLRSLFFYARAMALGRTGHSPKIYRRKIRSGLYGGK